MSGRDWRRNDPFFCRSWCCYWFFAAVCAAQFWLTMLLARPDNPKIVPSPWEVWTPSNTWFLGFIRVGLLQSTSQSVQPFLQGSGTWQTWQTDRQTDHGLMMIDYMNLTTSVTRSRVVTGSRYVFRDATYRIQTRNFHSHINVGDRKSDIVSAINQGATIVYVVPVGV